MRSALFFILIVFVLPSCDSGPKTGGKEEITGDSTQIAGKESVLTDSLLYTIACMLKDSDLFNASVGIYIALDSAENVIFEWNPDMTLVPASVMKIVTTTTALETVGGGASFRTVLQYDGEIVNRVLEGNIYIKGGGDPTLGRGEVNLFSRWGAAIRDLGIDSIHGKIIGDASIYEDELPCPTWGWGEIANYYCQPASGLTFHENTFTLKFNAGAKGSFRASSANMSPFVPGLVFNNISQGISTVRNDVYFLGMPYGQSIDIAGYYPDGKGQIIMEGIIPDPAYAVSAGLWNWLRKNGIPVSDSCTTQRDLRLAHVTSDKTRKDIMSVHSPSLFSIISETNMVSRNLFAEHILKYMGLKRSGKGNRQSGLNAIMTFWSGKGIDTRGMFLNDGSGISRHDGVTVRQIAGILCYMKNKSSNYKSFRNTLPVAGQSGTLRRLCKGSAAEGNVFAKSGTMSRVVSYAGYANADSNHTIIFVIITNNFNCPMYEMKHKLEKIMIRLAGWKPVPGIKYPITVLPDVCCSDTSTVPQARIEELLEDSEE
jgi:D-alanyl-D-alanine carboxypeptidase/D-alanyl-D-alanine-endopeptidase (penicillin-binding protein 4)